MSVEHLFAGLHVAELALARDWYERLLGRGPDLVPNDSEAAWRLTETGWIVLIAGAGRAGGATHTLLVEDLGAFLDGARERGVEVGPIEPVGEGMRQSILADPDGNRLKIAAPVTPG